MSIRWVTSTNKAGRFDLLDLQVVIVYLLDTSADGWRRGL